MNEDTLTRINLRLAYCYGWMERTQFTEKLAEATKKRLVEAVSASGVPSEEQQEALSRLIAGKGASHD